MRQPPTKYQEAIVDRDCIIGGAVTVITSRWTTVDGKMEVTVISRNTVVGMARVL